MGLPNVGTQLRGSGKNQSVWKLEWTCSGATGEVTLDSLQSDSDPRIETPVADGASTGITTVTFPKCDRAWVLHCSIEAPTPGTAEQVAKVADIDVDAGTLKFVVLDDTLALEDATENSRARLVLLLEYP
jgi:hypothetical protein